MIDGILNVDRVWFSSYPREAVSVGAQLLRFRGVSICSFLFGVNGLRTRWFSSSLVFPGAHLASKEEEKTAKFLRISQKLRETISTNRDFFF